jgi:DNA topoisomerase VI subunit B
MLLKQTDSDSELLYSNVQGESIPFSIGDPSVIIDIIRKKIYSHPIRTMVQEYLSNAKDSCLEAGKDSSCIHVSLPTHLKPEFSIRDYGVGMSDERIREVFVQYGISTKRNSVSQLGYFGIGSKSGWAYTD